MPRRTHSLTKTISSEMDGYDIDWVCDIGALADYDYLAQYYRMVAYGRKEGRLTPPKRFYKSFDHKKGSEAPMFKAGMSSLLKILEKAILNGDIKAVRALAEIMEHIEKGDHAVSAIDQALRIFHLLTHESEAPFWNHPDFANDPELIKAKQWKEKMPLTTAQYRAFVYKEMGSEPTLTRLRAALKRLNIPVKKVPTRVKKRINN